MNDLQLLPATRPVSRPEPVRTWANLVTLGRTLVAVLFGVAGAASGDLAVLGLGYAVYWAGDIADGALARARHEETRLGAVLDVVADRACTAVLATAYLAHAPGAELPLLVFLVQFMVLDAVLTLSFLRWPLLSSNDFHLVDRQVWLLNWSRPAKALNTALVLLLVLLGWWVAATVVALAVTAVKIWSLRRVSALLDAGSG